MLDGRQNQITPFSSEIQFVIDSSVHWCHPKMAPKAKVLLLLVLVGATLLASYAECAYSVQQVARVAVSNGQPAPVARFSTRYGARVSARQATSGANRTQVLAMNTRQLGQLGEECISSQNKWRALHQAPDLVHDDTLSNHATWWAQSLAERGVMQHSSDSNYGENIAWSSDTSSSCAQLVHMWYSEVQDYDFGRPGFSGATGHFTQLVWRNSRQVGCGAAMRADRSGGLYLVCNYSPAGNVLGAFPDNVKPATN